MPGMSVINLAFEFAVGFGACYAYALSVYHHNKVTHFHAWRKSGFVFAQQNARDARGKASQGLPIGIDQNPVALNFSGFRIVRFLLHFRHSVS
jgi:hypothetical protein